MNRLETADAYDFWSGMWAISYAVGRSAYVARGSLPLRLNLFCVFVSESGVGRKSTAISQVEKLLGDMPMLLTGYTTANQFEAVLEDLTSKGGSAEVGIAISEMARFLGRQSGMKDLPIMLTDLYDCPEKRVIFGAKSHKKDGPVRITEVRKAWVSLLTGCAPAWLGSAVHPQVLEGGFSSRTLFIVANRGKELRAWPDEADDTNEMESLRNDLLQMRATAKSNGEILLSDGGRGEYTTWYTHRKGAKSHHERIFESREADHILRCAAILCINGGGWEIQRQHVAAAIKLIGEVKAGMASLFFDTEERTTKITTGIERVREKLAALRPDIIRHRDLYISVRNYLSVEMFRTLMLTMQSMGLIEVIRKKNGQGAYYKGLTRLTEPGHLQELARVLRQHHGS